MPTLEEFLASASTAFAALIAESPDRCSVITRSEASDGRGGTTITETTAATNVPILYKQASANTTQLAGSAVSHITHDLFLLGSSVTRNIAPSSKIVVAARGLMPQQVFEQPVRLDATLESLVHVGAMLKL